MTRWTLGLILMMGFGSGFASAQYMNGIPGSFNGYTNPGYTYGASPAAMNFRNGPVVPLGYTPGVGAGTMPPLSPYLNLARSGNPAVNYFYGVRPWQAANNFQRNAAMSAPMQSYSQARTGFIPFAANPTEQPLELPPAGQPVTLSPSGHPVIYGNRFGTMAGGYPGVGMGSNRQGVFSNTPPQAFNRTGGQSGAGSRPRSGSGSGSGSGAGSTIPRSR